MIRLTSVVLPAPVGPTIATVWPGSATSDRCSISRRSGEYENVTSSNTTRPAIGGGSAGTGGSGDCSSVSSSSSTRSSEAMPDWNTFIIDASWVSGIEKLREYWMNAWTSPTVIAPLDTRSPPMTATSTYCTLPRKNVSGCIRLDMNWAPNAEAYSESLVARKRASTSPWRPKALTIACPVNASSIWAFNAPVLLHWARNFGRARPATRFMPKTDSGTVISATSASSHEIVNIITVTPTSSSTDMSIWISVCCRLCARLSRSLVTRLSRSPRCWRSM